jgi:hypothetical protein
LADEIAVKKKVVAAVMSDSVGSLHTRANFLHQAPIL